MYRGRITNSCKFLQDVKRNLSYEKKIQDIPERVTMTSATIRNDMVGVKDFKVMYCEFIIFQWVLIF